MYQQQGPFYLPYRKTSKENKKCVLIFFHTRIGVDEVKENERFYE
jgi:hypothetical protein